MTLLFVHPPFCTPASPPYSISYLIGFLNNNIDINIKFFDANLYVHKEIYPEEKKYFSNLTPEYNKEEYEPISTKFLESTKKLAMDNAHKVLRGENPSLLNEVVEKILINKPRIVAFSIVYASQVFYTTALIKELKKQGITTVIGGSAISLQLSELADIVCSNEVEFLEYLNKKPIEHDKLKIEVTPDYSIFDFKDYFVNKGVIPIRSTTACYYQKCTFCTHHNKTPYFEYSLPPIMKSIEKTNTEYVFFTDDMIHKKRLLEIARLIKPLNKKWMCQLKPSRELDKETLQTLYNAGLRIVIWGVESGSQRILDLMKKQTNIEMIENTLKNSKEVGIINAIYIMFGFPTETKEEFKQTVELIERNKNKIDLIMSSIFGLQKGTPIFERPKDFGIKEVVCNKRTLLGPRINYSSDIGLSRKEVKNLKKKVTNKLNRINKFPNKMNYFREHMLNVIID